MSYFLYSETAFHHEGDINYLLKLVELTKKGNFEGVKFQVIGDLSTYMVDNHSQFDAINKMVLKLSEWTKIIRFAKSLGLKVILMPLDMLAIDWVIKHSELVDFIDIHSVSFYDQPLLQRIKDSQKPIILGIGGRTEDEIEEAVEFFGEQLKILMHGFQAFPTDLINARLLRISALIDRYPNILIGYADHSPYDNRDAIKGIEYAYLLGARVFEKHITLDEGVERIDYSAAVGLDKMLIIKNQLEKLNIITLDSNVFNLFPDEEKYRERQKKLVASRKILKGEKLTQTNTVLKVIEEERDSIYFNKYLNGTFYATEDIKKNMPIFKIQITD
ncbi:N-acetylneuraminate synthase family protein [Bacillus sp. Bva_UNVM-123]|uniref:N-acetylneuraminate synthase family protein n=1 Tax=Bacillus sp. Bva_UNVM-123 TaxID=2829798 RepID=UPI00391F635D